MTDTELVPVAGGNARITWCRAEVPRAEAPRAVLALGHGATTGVDAPDLRALATALPPRGITVALVEQPWLVAGGFGPTDTATLDSAWCAVWPRLDIGRPVITGGRSAGSRVAARTARRLGAAGVLALSFPLHAPGRPEPLWDTGELYDTGLPTLVVQGGRDPFGRPATFPPAPPGLDLVEIPGAGHVFTAPDTARIVTAVAGWLARVVPATSSG